MTVRKKTSSRRVVQRLSAPERREEVIRAAYGQLAESGYAGLRTRLVAATAGINHATLHHHFPTKEDLVQGVVEYVLAQLSELRIAESAASPQDALSRLRRELDDILARIEQTPELFIVLAELAVAAAREPAVADMLEKLDGMWRMHLTGILQQGIREGTIRRDIDVEGTVSTLMVQFKGISYQSRLPHGEMARVLALLGDQVVRWLSAD